jgi:lysine 2,3-aminomutase
VPIQEGRALLESLRGRVTGLAWPTYVLDIPGGHGKVPVGPDYLREDGSVRAPCTGLHSHDHANRSSR